MTSLCSFNWCSIFNIGILCPVFLSMDAMCTVIRQRGAESAQPGEIVTPDMRASL